MLAVVLAGVSGCGKKAGEGVYPLRLVFVHDRQLDNPAELRSIREIAKTASAHGLNGMVISAGLDRLDLKGPDYFEGVKQLKEISREYGLKIIPLLFSAGYGFAAIAHDKNLAEGLPVRDAIFVVNQGRAVLMPEPPVEIANGSLEDTSRSAPAGFEFSGEPGREIFLDREIRAEGQVAVRLENSAAAPGGAVRIAQRELVHAYRCYRLRCLVKTEGLEPAGSLTIEIRGGDRTLNSYDPRLGPDNDWRVMTVGFNTWGYDTVKVSVGTQGAEKGRVWVDDLRLEEVGLTNVLRRSGTPLVVRGEKNGQLYEEGKDFAALADTLLDFLFEHEGPSIELLQGSRIREGERLRVSWYHGQMTVQRKGQVTVCMSAPELYEIWKRNARLIHRYLAPEMYFLDMDEIRAGGTDEACTSRGLSMGQILGDCFTRQATLLREVNPEARIMAWSDMLEPGHNAGDKWGKYYVQVNGLFTGAAEYVPKDMIWVSWWYDVRKESLAFLASHNFQILGSIYCENNLQLARDWQADLKATPGVVGVMYTTWDRNYDNLAQFGDLFSRPEN